MIVPFLSPRTHRIFPPPSVTSKSKNRDLCTVFHASAMEFKTILKKYPVFILGLYFLSLGIVLIVRSALGTTPISSINYVLSLNSTLSLGTWTFLFNLLLILGQFWLIRDCRSRQDIVEILLQIPFSFLFAAFIDFNMMLTGPLQPGNYGLSMALLLAGCVVQAIGVVLEIKPRIAMMSAEAFVQYASQRYHQEFGKFKVYFDVTLVTLAAILSFLLSQSIEGIREGSLIAACITGYIVTFLNRRVITRKTLYRLLPVLQKNHPSKV